MILDKFKTPKERAMDIAKREKLKRKKHKITQLELSKKVGVSLPTIKRFEQTGEISFLTLLKIADVLEETEEFDQLFTKLKYNDIEEILNEKN